MKYSMARRTEGGVGDGGAVVCGGVLFDARGSRRGWPLPPGLARMSRHVVRVNSERTFYRHRQAQADQTCDGAESVDLQVATVWSLLSIHHKVASYFLLQSDFPYSRSPAFSNCTHKSDKDHVEPKHPLDREPGNYNRSLR